MVRELIQIAHDSGLDKLEIEFITQQEAGIRVFSDLGFQKVALLQGHAKDLQRQTRDLLVMVYDLTLDDETFAAQ